MSRDLLAGATPQPWRVGPILARAYEGTHEIVGADDATLAVTGGKNDPHLLVAAVNEYEALLNIEEEARCLPVLTRAIGPYEYVSVRELHALGDALARLDAIRSTP